jgi:hypothetical protein
MPVFISHRTQDDGQASRIALRLERLGVPTYQDHFDPTLERSHRITARLVAAIKQCTHLMALVTDATRESWWVPFEIGVAREAPRRIATYKASVATLPEYLDEWPILRSDSDLEKFAAAYHKDDAGEPVGGMIKAAYRTIHSPDDFHWELKASLGQR